MLIIRKPQREAYAEDRLQQLHAWLGPHLRKNFPARLAHYDDDALANFIRSSVARAKAHGASRSESICKFVHVCVVFGQEFESLPWAKRSLSEETIADPNQRIEVMCWRARAALAAKGRAS